MKLETMLRIQKYLGWLIVGLILLQVVVMIATVANLVTIIICGCSLSVLAWGLTIRKKLFNMEDE